MSRPAAIAAGWPRYGSVSSSPARPRPTATSAIAAASDRNRAGRRTRTCGSGLLFRQHLLDHLSVISRARIHLAVDREHPQHPALRRRIVEARIAAEPGQNRHILLSVELVGDWRRIDARPGLEGPKL